jgi:hypothetical protein
MDEQGFKSTNFGVLLLIKTFIVPYLISVKLMFKDLDYILYLFWVIIIAIPSMYILSKSEHKLNHILKIYFLFALYVVVTPRMLDYSFFILVLPSAYILHLAVKNTFLQLIMLAIICKNLFGYYQPIFVAFGLFLIYLYYIYSLSNNKSIELGGNY